jgi:membrane associated rhomboid family serine protease
LNLVRELGLFYFDSPYFAPYQLITHMFMHGGLMHIGFNMFALVMFGSNLERMWGGKRFLIFYLVTGFGAAALHMGVNMIQVYNAVGSLTPGTIQGLTEGYQFTGPNASILNGAYLTPTVGASGAIYGLLMAFAVLFPNTELFLIFIPVPIKAKYFVPGLIIIEVFLGVSQFSGDNIAHFAHLGGMLFGYILLKMWGKNRNEFY